VKWRQEDAPPSPPTAPGPSSHRLLCKSLQSEPAQQRPLVAEARHDTLLCVPGQHGEAVSEPLGAARSVGAAVRHLQRVQTEEDRDLRPQWTPTGR